MAYAAIACTVTPATVFVSPFAIVVPSADVAGGAAGRREGVLRSRSKPAAAVPRLAPACSACSAVGFFSAQIAEERPHIVDEQRRLLERREISAARHLGPPRDVEPRLEPSPRRPDHFLRKVGARRRRLDAPRGGRRGVAA